MNKNRKKFILSVDDFGISPLANKNILTLLKNKSIDRVSIMINGVFTPKELKKLVESEVKIDLHLDIERKNGKRAGEGILLRGTLFSVGLLSKRMRPKSVSTHWEKQIEKFHSLIGKYPDGLNSHQHIHYFPPYFKVITKLAQKNDISHIRFGKESFIESNTATYRILAWLHKKNKKVFASSNLESSDYLVSLDWIKKMDNFLSQKKNGTTEIICHPEIKKEFEMIKIISNS
ncbi:MAG TPA: hypothetical protein DIC35_01685 [Candidatus Moranbacteria bacterium]|nr:hypothetical protein [Candidatus Moranbacteria bacterium]